MIKCNKQKKQVYANKYVNPYDILNEESEENTDIEVDTKCSTVSNSTKVGNIDSTEYVSINSIELSPVTYNFGSQKLNTSWILWFHHDPNDWNLTGYKQITTFNTVDDYLKIMSYLHMVTSIKTINLYLFRKGIEPTWEDKANSNGGFWSFKVSIDTGIDQWRKMCDKAVCETILKTAGSTDINGTVNGISITSKLMNTIIKIWVSDRKISNNQWLDTDILNNINSKIIYQVISPER
jgi:hypothetical protein